MTDDLGWRTRSGVTSRIDRLCGALAARPRGAVLGEKPRHESLTLTDPLDLDRDGVDGLLEMRQAVDEGCGAEPVSATVVAMMTRRSCGARGAVTRQLRSQ